MKLKRISAAAVALVMALSLVPAALAAERPEGWTPADGARGPRNDRYETVITINGEALESCDYTRDIPGSWETETITVILSELPAVPAGYVPLRAIAQADGGSASWFKEENMSYFFIGDYRIQVTFLDMSVSVDDEPVEGAEAILLEGTTFVPVSVIDGLEGFAVTDNSEDGAESYEIKTPNGEPLIKLSKQLMEIAEMGMSQKLAAKQLERVWGEEFGFSADYVTDGLFFLPMMISPDTLLLGKVAEGQTEALEASLEAYRAQQEDAFTEYLSHNLPKTQDARFVTEGEWFMFLIGENADEVVEAFRAGVQAIDAAQNEG